MSIPRDENPFAPPRAAVLEAERPDAGQLVLEGQRVTASRAVAWFGEGWQLFKSSPGIWVAMFVIFFLASGVLAVLPLGSLVSSLCFPAVMGGIMIGCRTLEEGGTLELGHLFAGFRKNAGGLLLVGVLYMVGMMLIGFIAGIAAALMIPMMMGASANLSAGTFSGAMAMAPMILVVALVVLALMMPLLMALWFAPALVVFHEVQPMAAMRSSFQGCLRNFVPFLAYGIVAFLLAIVAVIPVGLGLLVYGPLVWATMYVGYRDIFVRPA